MEEQKHPKVFISYSHIDDAYEQRMLEFADRLRSDGIDANNSVTIGDGNINKDSIISSDSEIEK